MSFHSCYSSFSDIPDSPSSPRSSATGDDAASPEPDSPVRLPFEAANRKKVRCETGGRGGNGGRESGFILSRMGTRNGRYILREEADKKISQLEGEVASLLKLLADWDRDDADKWLALTKAAFYEMCKYEDRFRELMKYCRGMKSYRGKAEEQDRVIKLRDARIQELNMTVRELREGLEAADSSKLAMTSKLDAALSTIDDRERLLRCTTGDLLATKRKLQETTSAKEQLAQAKEALHRELDITTTRLREKENLVLQQSQQAKAGGSIAPAAHKTAAPAPTTASNLISTSSAAVGATAKLESLRTATSLLKRRGRLPLPTRHRQEEVSSTIRTFPMMTTTSTAMNTEARKSAKRVKTKSKQSAKVPTEKEKRTWRRRGTTTTTKKKPQRHRRRQEETARNSFVAGSPSLKRSLGLRRRSSATPRPSIKY